MKVHRGVHIPVILLILILGFTVGCDAVPFLNNAEETSPDSVSVEELPVNDQSEEPPLAVQVNEVMMGTGINPDTLEIDNPTSTFAREDEIFLLLSTNNESGRDLLYRVEWYDPRGMNVQTEENVLHPGQSKWYLSAKPGPGGWALGAHSVLVYFDGNLTSTLNFSVNES
jgi:uncharacterized protein YcfL